MRRAAPPLGGSQREKDHRPAEISANTERQSGCCHEERAWAETRQAKEGGVEFYVPVIIDALPPESLRRETRLCRTVNIVTFPEAVPPSSPESVNSNSKTAVDNTTRSSVLVDADHPWLGLLSFREQHRRFFFGREREIADLHERARRNRLTVLFGPSGLGKTSILPAGLCPLLRESGALPVLIRLTYPGRETDAVQPPPLITQIAEKISTILRDASPISPKTARPPPSSAR